MRWKDISQFVIAGKPTLPAAVTYHKLNMDVKCDIFQAFEADLDPILGVVQIT